MNAFPTKSQNSFRAHNFHALCLAGFLNIEIGNLILYTCYKYDKISGDDSDPSALRLAAQTPSGDIGKRITQWEKDTTRLKTSFNDLICVHKRIQVDDSFNGEYDLINCESM